MGDFISISEENFQEQILNSPLPMILEFSGQNCKPCRTLEPLLSLLGKEWTEKACMAQVEVEKSPNLAIRFGVMSVPTTILFKAGEACARVNGLHSVERIRKIFLPYI